MASATVAGGEMDARTERRLVRWCFEMPPSREKIDRGERRPTQQPVVRDRTGAIGARAVGGLEEACVNVFTFSVSSRARRFREGEEKAEEEDVDEDIDSSSPLLAAQMSSTNVPSISSALTSSRPSFSTCSRSHSCWQHWVAVSRSLQKIATTSNTLQNRFSLR